MCNFLTVSVPKQNLNALLEGVRALRLHVEQHVNPAVARLFPRDQWAVLVTNGHCSCGVKTTRGEPLHALLVRLGPAFAYAHTVRGNPFTELVDATASARALH